ncbi:ATP-binding protein [Nostoc sp. 'Peltigera membranacea cyanobiont' N6]|uniref:ATP-binding protein n=1 Tax=Nostoc sp. 'Peltigera membranacea cyanobiont' N6 TaxID=1261031 RepID=UPI000CF324CD|nr:ATP-binding protein [Nostoc sp. 'Peltigera membranacea cyanobiont' N6]AVH64464.1 AAA ATPase [Nostoc sp. 'Peltigera membranacea cyanobiont' N6]
MEAEEALESIRQIFEERKGKVVFLGKLEEKVFLLSWQGMDYGDMTYKIYKPTGKPYTEQYFREVGKKLIDKIKRVLNIDDLEKRYFRQELENFFDKNYNYPTQKLSDITAPEPDYTTSQELPNNTPSERNHNPFIPFNGRVEEKDLFFDREREIRRVFEVLNSGSSVVLIGEEGIGKSSLLSIICQEAETRLKVKRQPVFLDLNLLHNESQFYSDLCHGIGIPDSKDYQLTRNLRSCKILLAIDNVGKLTGEGFTRNIRDYLRGLAEGSNAPLKLILAATEPLNNLFNDSQEQGNTSPLAGICQEEHIHPWNEATMRTFITNRLARTSVSFTEEEIIQLIQESGGHPRKVMQLCYQTYSRYVESLQ